MREYPVFIPWEGEHLAAVLSVPEGRARALALLPNVPGAPRSHRYQVWALAAERLAAAGVASIRWETTGFHDSTGSAETATMAVTPVDEALAVARFGQRAVGVETLVAVGTCLGAQTALAVAAASPECVGAVCVMPRMTNRPVVRRRLSEAAKREGALGFLQRHPAVRELVVGRLGRLGLRVRAPLRASLPKALEHAAVLFVFDREHLESRSRIFSRVRAVVGRLPPDSRGRFELRVVPTWGLDRFGSVASQDATLEAIDEWVERCLGQGQEPATGRSVREAALPAS